MADAAKRNLAAWVAVGLSVLAYGVATTNTIAAQGQRITTLEREMGEMKAMRDQLGAIQESVAAMRAEQAVLHGRPADWRAR